MNLTGRPIYQKPEEAAPRPDYLGAVAQLPCVICEAFGEIQNSPTEVHHWKSGRYGNERTPDSQAIPLCHSHHNKLRPYPGDEAKIGFHNAQEQWEAKYGQDHEYTEVTQDRIEREYGILP